MWANRLESLFPPGGFSGFLIAISRIYLSARPLYPRISISTTSTTCERTSNEPACTGVLKTGLRSTAAFADIAALQSTALPTPPFR